MEQIHPEYIKASRRIILRGQTTPQTRSERTQGLSYDDLELCTQCSQFDRPDSMARLSIEHAYANPKHPTRGRLRKSVESATGAVAVGRWG